MYCITDICFLCLNNNIQVQSVLTEDTDGIVVNVKLRCFFPEIIDSTPDAHKLVCSECIEKLRISYDFKQSVIRNSTVFRDYIDKLKCQHKKSYQQLLVDLIRSKYRTINPFTKDVTAKKDEKLDEKHDSNSLKIENENLNLTSINQEQLNTHDQSCQLTTNENDVLFTKFSCQPIEINVKTENIEIEEVYIKEERNVEDDFSRNYLDEESKESEDTNSTSSQSGYNDERTNKEAKKRRYKCRESPKAFTGPSELKAHTSSNSLNTDKLIHTSEKLHACDMCKKSFKKKSNLVTHKRSHDNVRPYQCSICKKTFTRNNSLNTHMYIHTGQKPYHCQICQYKCRHAVNLKKHIIRTHTGKRPYTCKHCLKSYAWPNDLKEHIKKHHNGEDD